MTPDMEPVLLDTSVWIEALRGKRSDVVATAQRLLRDDRVLICGPVIFEIKRGLRDRERKKVLPLLDALIRLAVDEAVWDAAGVLDARLRGSGITIPPMDVIIAQVCLNHKVFLFTMDEHFNSVPGLRIFEHRVAG
ncbi:MAG: PIN domain-containing protein [Deltaproteobacteria bacterium]|nr:PIN domain-containing protein [Deltaproteobacteria bacterium]MBW1819037.1 PIN domain-containing protein [Deltaproteobacteria bacterium]MBW2285911.1 PIN domain-containing protein [Deltaproteobacteria bacterium]